jgi:hypothetical protein
MKRLPHAERRLACAGLIVSGDMTQALNYGYVPGFNRAFFLEVYEAAGLAFMVGRSVPGS